MSTLGHDSSNGAPEAPVVAKIKLKSDEDCEASLGSLCIWETEELVYSYEFTVRLGAIRLTYWFCRDLEEGNDPTPASYWWLSHQRYSQEFEEFPDMDLVRLLMLEADDHSSMAPLAAPLIADELAVLAGTLALMADPVIQARRRATAGMPWSRARWEKRSLSHEDLDLIAVDLGEAYWSLWPHP